MRSSIQKYDVGQHVFVANSYKDPNYQETLWGWLTFQGYKLDIVEVEITEVLLKEEYWWMPPNYKVKPINYTEKMLDEYCEFDLFATRKAIEGYLYAD